MSTRRCVLVALVVVGLAVGGCSDKQPSELPGEPPTYQLDKRAVRPAERALSARPVVDGDTTFQLIGLTTGLDMIVGSHAEFAPRGQFVRLRLVVTGTGRSSVVFNARRQRLVLADGSEAMPDTQAMTIKRQPDTVTLGPAVRIEFDLYYDIPADSVPVGFTAFGGATLTDMKDAAGTRAELS